MKNLLIIILTIIYTTTPTVAYGLTPTPDPSGTPATTQAEKDKNLIDQINNLKEKVASKVAELKLVEKRGMIGIVTEVSGNKISLTDIQNNYRFADVDELTKFTSSSTKGSFGISDITKGMELSVVGLYNKQSKRILARFVEVVTVPSYISGAISDIDKVNYTVTVISENNVQTKLDIENVTKTYTYTKADETVKSGFSKMQVGDRIYSTGYPVKDSKDRVTATRVITFPEFPKDPKINVPETSSDSFEKTTPTPSRKVTPTR